MIQINSNSVDFENFSPQETEEFVNVIQPSQDIINLKRTEFNIDNLT